MGEEVLKAGLEKILGSAGANRSEAAKTKFMELLKKWRPPTDGEQCTFSSEDKSTLYLVFWKILESRAQLQLQASGRDQEGFVELLLELAMWCLADENAFMEIASPINLAQHAFDYETIDGCKRVFVTLRSHFPQFKTDKLWKKASLHILRVLNGLLRRLSKTTDTIFCGQIQMLIADLFPLDEPSGLNKFGKTNKGNITVFEEEEEEEAEAAAADEAEAELKSDEKAPDKAEADGKAADEPQKMDETVDAAPAPAPAATVPVPPSSRRFYSILWSLQKYFSDPALLASAEHLLRFITGLTAVLDAFENNKLGSLDASKAKNAAFFPKYLTSSKLLSLQMRDPAFRRHVMLQCLISFQSLETATFATKINVTLNSKHTEKIRALRTRVLGLLETTPVDGDGKVFGSKSNQIIDKNEKIWTKWKDQDRCPSRMVKSMDISQALQLSKPEPAKKSKKALAMMDMDFLMMGGEPAPSLQKVHGKLQMGTAELGRLWALPANMDACAAEERNYAPDSAEYLGKMLEEEEENDMDEDVRLKNDVVYSWRCLRLMMSKDFLTFVKSTGDMKEICKFKTEEKNGPKDAEKKDDKDDKEAKEIKEEGKTKEKEADAEAPAPEVEATGDKETKKVVVKRKRPASKADDEAPDAVKPKV